MSIANELNKLRTYMSNAYTSCQNKNATMPVRQRMSNLASTIDSIQQGEIPKGAAIDGVKWTSEWETKSVNGTIVDVVVGDTINPKMSIAVVITNWSTTQRATIYWGDGTSTLCNATVSETYYMHEYETAGHYEVRIDNNARNIRFGHTSITAQSTKTYQAYMNNRSAVRRVQQWGGTLSGIGYCFAYCYYLNSEEGGYESELPPFPPTITSMSYAFAYCRRYRGHVPYLNHLTNCQFCVQTFYCCYELQGTVQIMPPKTAQCTDMYGYCNQLTAIPYDVFPSTLTNTLTLASGCFTYLLNTGVQSYPKIDHLTKCSNMGGMFSYCVKLTGDLPRLPPGSTLTSINSMFSYNYNASKIPDNYFGELTKLQQLQSCFNNCTALKGNPPTLPTTITAGGLSGTFTNCYAMEGNFPAIPSNYKGSLYATFNNCYNMHGSLPDLPAGANDLRSTFAGCYNATGRFPSLGHIGKLSSPGYATSLFNGCYNVKEPPLTFFNSDATVNGTITSFNSMFAYCRSLQSFTHDLTAFTSCSDCSYMFRDCYMLEEGPTLKMPPNVTNLTYCFYYCQSLRSQPVHWTDYAKLTNITCIHQYCNQLDVMRNEDGELELRKEKYLNAKTTSVTSAFGYCSTDLMKMMYDGAVANGKSGTYYGNSTITNYDNCYIYTGGIA